jgi:hypothetical protein
LPLERIKQLYRCGRQDTTLLLAGMSGCAMSIFVYNSP